PPTYYYASDGRSFTSSSDRDSYQSQLNEIARQESIRQEQIRQEQERQRLAAEEAVRQEAARVAAENESRQKAASVGVELPPNWFQLGAQDKVNWLVGAKVSEQQLRGYGIPQSDIEAIKQYGYYDVRAKEEADRLAAEQKAARQEAAIQEAERIATQQAATSGGQSTVSGKTGGNNMATFYSNKGQYTADQIRDFINSPNFFKDEDIQYLVNQKLIRPSDDPGVLKQRATYYGLTQLLGMPESEANSAMAAVFPQGGQEDVNALAKLYEQSMITGVPTGALEEAAAKLGLYGTTDSYDIQRILAERGSTNAAVTGGGPSPEAIVQYGPTVAKTGEGNLIFSPNYDAPGSETNRYALAQAVTGAKTDAEKAAALAEATKQQQAMDAAARAATDARLQQIMSDREKAMALGLPPSTDMSGLSALSKYDFSKAAPQLRMAGMYANPLLMPTN
ncbi:MAG: hypothetical protein EBZ61_11340, partial [Micrococcales bacterium]|nr:hypothetical protein [Micrococcales bacterium]